MVNACRQRGLLIHKYLNKSPQIDKTAYIAEGAYVIGDVEIGKDASIWFGSVLRGDANKILIGARSNVQDLCVIHVNHSGRPTIIENAVTVGHRAVLEGCHIKSGSLVGMGAVVLDDVVVEERAFVAAGSVVSPGTIIPSLTLARGVPARVVRDLTEKEVEGLVLAADTYCDLKEDYLKRRSEF